jgi:uncharacterized repeat protein (TIGR01451 family)/MYXO-CTERM domain-containing protein
LWTSDTPAAGQALADQSIMPAGARSTSVLSIPAGAQVTYARLYWGSNLTEDITAASTPAIIERPGTGGFSVMVTPNQNKGEIATAVGGGGGNVYQATADITTLVQLYGSGAYRVGNVVRRSVLNRDEDVQYAAWAMVVVYQNPQEPIRNIALFDGLDGVGVLQSTDVSIVGFNAPMGSTAQGKLGIIAYEGDSDKFESLTFNGQMLSDAQNPANNVFNSTRSTLGMPVSVTGDLPQLTGTMASMSGLDLDIIDVSSLVKPGDTSAAIHAGSIDDVYFIGAFVTSIASHKPVLQTTLSSDPVTVKPGDTITFTSTTKNIGDDDAGNVVIRQPIPDGLTYVPGSIKFVSGPDQTQNGPKTDAVGDDQAEVTTDPNTGKPVLVIRIGKGANGTTGGTISPTDPPVVVTYQMKAAPNATGDIPVQSTTTGTPGSNPNLPPTSFPSGNPTTPGAPTVVHVPTAVADLRVTVTKTPPDAQPGTPTNYHVDISNVGKTTDPGPLHVTVTIPPGGTINSVKPGPGWTCMQSDRTITCTRPGPINAGETWPVVDVNVTDPATPPGGNGNGNNPGVTVVVGSDGAIDPNPADNTYTEFGGSLRIAGGGFGCSMGQGSAVAGLWALSAAALLLFALGRRRHRRSVEA